jgi:dynein heavy chain
MTEVTTAFDLRCKRLPRKLKEWLAYDEVAANIQLLFTLAPILTQLSKPSIKSRHWAEINSNLIIKNLKSLPYSSDDFRLKSLLESNIILIKDEVEEICDGADKQLAIEKKLIALKDSWGLAQFEFTTLKTRFIIALIYDYHKQYSFVNKVIVLFLMVLSFAGKRPC